MGKSTISMAIFNSYVCLPEGIPNKLNSKQTKDLSQRDALPTATGHETLTEPLGLGRLQAA